MRTAIIMIEVIFTKELIVPIIIRVARIINTPQGQGKIDGKFTQSVGGPAESQDLFEGDGPSNGQVGHPGHRDGAANWKAIVARLSRGKWLTIGRDSM